MEKLFLPKGAVIQGERISITHEGDIHIENNLVPLSIKSLEGNIEFVPEGQVAHCSHLIAENGCVSVHAESMNAELISGKEVTLNIDELEVEQAIQAKEKAHITGSSITVADLFAGELEIGIKGDFIADSIEVKGELVLSAKSIKVNHIKAQKISIDVQDSLEIEHLAAEQDVYVANGAISVKYLDCESFSAAPEVKGIIMVATPEHVKAEGVRGFIRPQEFQVFSKTDNFIQISSGGNKKEAKESDHSKGPEKDSAESDDTDDATPHEPEIVTPEPEQVTQPVSQYETLDVEELEAKATDEKEKSTDVEIEEISEGSFETPPELPPEPPEYNGSDSNGEEESSESHSLDDISMETLNIDDDIEEDLDGSLDEELEDNLEEGLSEDDEFLEEQFSMDTVSEEEAVSLDIEHVEGELDSSFATSLDNLSELSDEQEMAMDAIELGDFEDDQSEWEFDQIEETPEAFPTNDKAAELPEEDDDFKTTELNFHDEITPSQVGKVPLVDGEQDQDQEIVTEQGQIISSLDQEYSTDSGELASVDLSFGPKTFPIDGDQGEEMTDGFESIELADDIPNDLDTETPGDSEGELILRLESLIEQIKDSFPDENYPKFISQIEVYLNEGRFKILRKKRNREAVISSFDRLDNPRISELAREFYTQLTDFFQDDL